MISRVGRILYYSKAALLARQDLNLQPPGSKPGVPPIELRAIAVIPEPIASHRDPCIQKLIYYCFLLLFPYIDRIPL